VSVLEWWEEGVEEGPGHDFGQVRFLRRRLRVSSLRLRRLGCGKATILLKGQFI